MGYYDADVYGQPEKFGLTPIGELYDPEACYSFDILAVWKHEDGRIFWGQSAGCSCPSPFETVTSLEDDELSLVTNESWEEFAKAVDEHCKPYTYSNANGIVYDKVDPQAADKTELLATVAKLL